ncbi:enoyl-CoA hydratase [Pseudomaricurvus alkylphenolicus]|jgi:enoyl-CoA hydratase|uniref:enoyl-CoA hydratase n=1 Tax=Pseudomaricurvus alkylphenolicus TaxID=1306991 RepID=UPI0014218FBD|nr:enoyl-CoA hydratase [Pseudomaricurvus alkylphenolicus]NIB39225.1 enoyl-CoA hydratase [Pseudomaricurvus alkylphenolicus]
MSEETNAAAEMEKDIVLYSAENGIATITMNRPKYNNAQNGRMTYELDDAFKRAVADDEVKVIVLKGEGKHFSAGHDIGTPGRDIHLSQERTSMWYDHANKEGGEFLYVREAEAYLGMCRRWRDIPKPTIAAVQGACIAGGLMLAWVCDLIVATDDAFFSDPVVRMGIPGVEYFAHPFELNPRIAKEFLFTGDRMSADRAYQMGMVNQVSSRETLAADVQKLAEKVAAMPRMGLALTKQAINHVEDLQGKRTGMEAAFAWHHFAHTHNDIMSGDKLGGYDAKAMARENKAQASEEA